MEQTAIYNPFIVADRLHFPSFTDAFGDLLKLEADKLRKEEAQRKDRNSKQIANPNATNAANAHRVTSNLNTPIPKKKKSHLAYGTVTPIPFKSKHKKPHSNNHSINTPIPNKTDTNLSIIITPAPKTRKKRIHKTDEESIVIMMADLMSPNPSHRCELSSPAPHDKNAKLLTQTPVKFPIVLPPTPSQHKKRSVLEEQWCADYFSKHIPVLTPVKKRENPVMLYDPSADTNVTMMLEASDAPFDQIMCRTKEAKAVDLLGDISMIAPSNHIEESESMSFGASNMFFTPNNDKKSVLFGSHPPSDIKKEEKEESFDKIKNDDDLIMNDEEFFETSSIDINNIREDHSTQTEPVLVVAEEDIPKIRYNGKLIADSMSMSAIYYDEYNKNNQRLNASSTSTQSDKIVYSRYNLFTPMLRHNKDSIDSFYEMSSDSDSDSINKRNLMSYDDINIKKRNGNKMFAAYKQSKLAQNPNWTVCNGKSKKGELI